MTAREGMRRVGLVLKKNILENTEFAHIYLLSFISESDVEVIYDVMNNVMNYI